MSTTKEGFMKCRDCGWEGSKENCLTQLIGKNLRYYCPSCQNSVKEAVEVTGIHQTSLERFQTRIEGF